MGEHVKIRCKCLHGIFTHKPCLAPIHANLLPHSHSVPAENGGRGPPELGRPRNQRAGFPRARPRPEAGGVAAAAYSRGSGWAVRRRAPLRTNQPQRKPRSKRKGEGGGPTSPRHGTEPAGLPGDKRGVVAVRRKAGRYRALLIEHDPPPPLPPTTEVKRNRRALRLQQTHLTPGLTAASPSLSWKGRLRTQAPVSVPLVSSEHRPAGTPPAHRPPTPPRPLASAQAREPPSRPFLLLLLLRSSACAVCRAGLCAGPGAARVGAGARWQRGVVLPQRSADRLLPPRHPSLPPLSAGPFLLSPSFRRALRAVWNEPLFPTRVPDVAVTARHRKGRRQEGGAGQGREERDRGGRPGAVRLCLRRKLRFLRPPPPPRGRGWVGGWMGAGERVKWGGSRFVAAPGRSVPGGRSALALGRLLPLFLGLWAWGAEGRKEPEAVPAPPSPWQPWQGRVKQTSPLPR